MGGDTTRYTNMSEVATTPVDDTKNAKEGPIICPGHSRPVPDLQISNIVDGDRTFMISSCLDGMPMLRDGDTGDWIGTFMGHKGAVWCTRMNADTTKAVSASADFSVKLWDAVTGSELYSWAHKHVVKSSIFTQDGKSVLCGGQDKSLNVHDVERYDAEVQVIPGDFAISHCQTVPDENLYLACGRSSNVHIWDKRTKEIVRNLEHDGKENVTDLSLSHDGTLLSTAQGKCVYFWDPVTLERVKKITLGEKAKCVSVNTELKRFITGSPDDLWVREWDYTGKELACNKGHHGPVRCCGVMPNNLTYATGSEDGTVRIWNWV